MTSVSRAICSVSSATESEAVDVGVKVVVIAWGDEIEGSLPLDVVRAIVVVVVASWLRCCYE